MREQFYSPFELANPLVVSRSARRLVVNVNFNVTLDRLAVAECRDELCAAEIGDGRITKTKQRWLFGCDLHTLQVSRCVDANLQVHNTGHGHRASRLWIM